MLKKRALKKIFVTTLTMFIILVFYTFPFVNKDSHLLRTNLEIEDITNLNTDSIYLINPEGYLVRTEVFINSRDIYERIPKIIDYLVIDNDKIPIHLNGYLPNSVQLLSFSLENKHLRLNFSKDLTTCSNMDIVVSGIVYSFLEQKEIEKVSLLIEDQILDGYQNLTKDVGINKEFLFSVRKDIQKVILYYMDNTNTYYVPVTKYLNDTREKVEIIVEELKKNHTNLISLENIHTQLLDYRNEENVFFLNFNEYLIEEDTNAYEKLLNTIAYSIFDNYDVNMVMFEVNHQKIKYISRN